MTLYVTNYAGVNASFNYSKSFLQNITNFWTEGNYLINITWEGNLTLQPNSTAFYVTVLATTTTTSTSSSTSSTTASSGEPEVIPSAGGGSSGGSGGGTRISEIVQKPEETSYSIPLLAPGELNIKIGDPYSNIISVLLNLNRGSYNSEIKVKNIDIPPEGVSLFGENALDYYEILTTNIPISAISETMITFKYKKTEKSIGLFHYLDGQWDELTSREIREDEYYVYYEAISYNLGYFVIAKKETNEKINIEAESAEFGFIKNIRLVKNRINHLNFNNYKSAIIVAINLVLLILISVLYLFAWVIKKFRKK